LFQFIPDLNGYLRHFSPRYKHIQKDIYLSIPARARQRVAASGFQKAGGLMQFPPSTFFPFFPFGRIPQNPASYKRAQ
jgi:hypothetical protein